MCRKRSNVTNKELESVSSGLSARNVLASSQPQRDQNTAITTAVTHRTKSSALIRKECSSTSANSKNTYKTAQESVTKRSKKKAYGTTNQ